MAYPLLTTFVSTVSQVEKAILYGATALILEDSKLSLRSFFEDFSVPHFQKIIEMEQKALSMNPSISLSVNCDVMIREKHFSLLEKLLDVLKHSSVRIFRIQDPGLIPWIKKNAPDFRIHLSTETGNNNMDSCQFFLDQGVNQQTFSNEIVRDHIKNISSQVSCSWELLVHGSLLIQYSPRRLLSHLNQEEKVWKKWAYDERRNKSPFLFYENPHGNFMYFWADRCLLEYTNDLLGLPLRSWLIDVRGGSVDYFIHTLKSYSTAMKKPQSFSNSIKRITAEKNRLRSFSERPFRPLFFRANRTDLIKKKKKLGPYRILGRVVHVCKKEFIIVELKENLYPNEDVFYQTPSYKRIRFKVEALKNLCHLCLDKAHPGNLVILPWKSHVVPQSLLLQERGDL